LIDMPGDFKREVAELARRIDEFRGIFDVSAKQQRLAALEAEMGSPTFWDDHRRAQELIRERTELSRTIGRLSELSGKAEELTVMLELASEVGDGSLDGEIADGIARLRSELDEYELKIMLSGPHDGKAAIVSIHPGAGGTESQDWAQMLMRMYLRWCERAGLKAEVVDVLPGEEAGIKSATIEVTGEYAYGYLRGETGVHRLVRISPFDASKRRQTSFASVAVAPEVDDVEVTVREDEIRVDVYRSSGPGGQGVNTADSAVRITHLPSGIVVACQNERSQLRNRDTAMRILKARLYELAEKKQREELAELTGHKKEIAFGSQIRSYTFHPYQLIKDHRTGVEVGAVDAVMDGDLDAFIKAYLLWARGQA
jgi:peptide chain release factor 2